MYVFKNKIVATYSALSISNILPLVQLKYSLNTFYSQPETVLNRVATSI